jgi:nucleotide-binding universal stress UspA family protein
MIWVNVPRHAPRFDRDQGGKRRREPVWSRTEEELVMSYPTVLLHMAIGLPNEARLASARYLAERFDALVIGSAACDPQPPASLEGIYPAEVIVADRGYASEKLGTAQAEFRRAFAGRENRIEWRSAFAPPAAWVAAQSRSADVVVTGAVKPELLADPNWRLDPGELVMRAGRPMLLVPEAGGGLGLRTVVVAWKDTREARRAVADALPLARLAERVLVVSVAEDDELGAHAGASDVVGWYHRHDIAAEARSLPPVPDAASQLKALALEEGASVIVAGAYGHSRTREWVFGGVTRDFMTQDTSQHLLLSH